MSTPAQIAANRENAQLSTGPQSAEGKDKVSQNACRHRATARKAVVLEDEREEYDQFLADYNDDLQPEGALQQTLFDLIVDSAWRLRRIRLAEIDLQLETPGLNDPLLVEKCQRRLELLTLYSQRAERSLHKAIDQLRKVQTEVGYRYESQPTSETERTTHDESPLVEFRRICPQLAVANERHSRTRAKEEEAALLAYLNAPLPSVKNPFEKTKPKAATAAA
jgi:hypothetical protein